MALERQKSTQLALDQERARLEAERDLVRCALCRVECGGAKIGIPLSTIRRSGRRVPNPGVRGESSGAGRVLALGSRS